MLVVPDNKTANKFLSVPGMIVYREEILYPARGEKLNALTEEKKVTVNPLYNIIIQTLLKRLIISSCNICDTGLYSYKPRR